MEFTADSLREALKNFRTAANTNSIDNETGWVLKYFCQPNENFCAGMAESTVNGWRKMRLNTSMASVVSTTTRAQIEFLDAFEKFRENNIQDETTMATFINEKGGIDEFMKKLESQGTEEKDH